MNQDLRDWLRKHFHNDFECQLFKGSMGEQSTMMTGMKGILGILAQAVAYFVHEEPKFCDAMIGSHKKLVEIEQATAANPERNMGSRQFAINIGALIEAALQATYAYHQATGRHGD